ncbi:MAG: cupin domain-containing protein, partial [Candidatus Binatia bacterium]|nr:cupin domain-containing protein [Candidatus Binatia bacterium]
TLWAESSEKVTFEWNKFSLFQVPGNYWHQFSNMQGDRPCRIVHYSYLPMAMETIRDHEILFNCPTVNKNRVYEPEDFYSAAQSVTVDGIMKSNIWRGNFFPDTLAWDKMGDNTAMGVGRKLVWLRFPNSPMWAHIGHSEPFTYKKAHRHGPGTIVIFLSGEGYSLMWPEGKEKVVCPWKEGAAIVPPNNWFHHHFVLSTAPARMLALHRSRLHPGLGDNVMDYENNEIQYWQEDPSIRKMFDEKLAERGLSSQMPEECYAQKDFDSNWGRQGKTSGGEKKSYATDFASRTSDYLKEREIG